MKKALWIVIMGLFMASSLFSQEFVGKKKEEVLDLMGKIMPDYSQAKVINNTYSYLKFQDSSGEQTILYFLDEKENCTSIKLMSTYINLGDIIVSLNKKYKSVGEDKWEFNEKGVDYVVELQRGQWFFTLITKRKNV